MQCFRKVIIFWIVVLDIIVWGQMGVYAETKNSNSNTIMEETRKNLNIKSGSRNDIIYEKDSDKE